LLLRGEGSEELWGEGSEGGRRSGRGGGESSPLTENKAI
jgi:hypothetical protein